MNNFLVAQFDSGFRDLSDKCMLPPGTTETAILDQYVQGFPKLHGISMQIHSGESHKRTRVNKFHSTVRPPLPCFLIPAGAR